MKALCPAGCGKKFVSAEHAKSHADVAHPNWIEEASKRKGWVTPYGFADFTHPVSYEEACEKMKAVADKLWSSTNKGVHGI